MINKELLVLIIGRILQIIISLLSIKIATKYLTPAEMGNYYLIISMVGFYGFFLVSPVGQYINRYTHKWYDRKKILNIFFLFNFYILLVSFVAFITTYIFYKFGIGNDIKMFYFMICISLYVYFHNWNQTIIYMINLLEKRAAFVLFAVFTQISGLLLSIYFISYYKNESIFWIFGQIISFGAGAILSLFYFIKKIQNNFNTSNSLKMISHTNLKSIFKFAAPLSLGVVFLWMQGQSYSIIIERYINADFLGYFGTGVSIAFAIFGAFEAIVIQYLYPIIYKSMQNDNKFKNIINNMLNLIIPIYFLLALFASFLSFYFVKILVNYKYYDVYIYTIFGVWASFFRISGNVIANIANAKLDTKKLVVPYAVGGILSAVCILIATKFENYEILIPVALVFASFMGFLAMYFQMNKLVKINLEIKTLLMVLLYSLPLLISIYFYKYSYELKCSFIITAIYGIYFLFVMYIIIKKRGVKI